MRNETPFSYVISPDDERATLRMLQTVFRCYVKCSEPMRQAVRELVAMIGDPATSPDEISMALNTLQGILGDPI